PARGVHICGRHAQIVTERALHLQVAEPRVLCVEIAGHGQDTLGRNDSRRQAAERPWKRGGANPRRRHANGKKSRIPVLKARVLVKRAKRRLVHQPGRGADDGPRFWIQRPRHAGPWRHVALVAAQALRDGEWRSRIARWHFEQIVADTKEELELRREPEVVLSKEAPVSLVVRQRPIANVLVEPGITEA